MFLGKNERGDYILDENETPVTEDELDRATWYLKLWHGGRRKRGAAQAGPCPHEDYPCKSVRECLGKIAWWRRYIGQIEVV